MKLRPIIKDKHGGFLDLFLFMIIAFALVVCSGIFLYIGTTTSTQLHVTLDNSSTSNVNYTQILQQTTDAIPASYQVLKWGSAVLIFGMILSIFAGSYMVTTNKIYFVPYVIIVFVAIILSVVIANAYDDLLGDATLGATLQGFTASNFMLLYLPIIISVTGIGGGVIMFAAYKFGSDNPYVQ